MNMTAKAQKTGNASTAAAEANQAAAKSQAQLRAERLAMHRKAVNMIAGMWKNRDGGPVDGMEYQDQMRKAW